MSFTITLPMPPSTNNLFAHKPGQGRFPTRQYRTWRKAADDFLWQNRVTLIRGPVEVRVQLEDPPAGKLRDADNCAKALLDWLVHHNLIESDDSRIVRKITLEWGEMTGAVVTVVAFSTQER